MADSPIIERIDPALEELMERFFDNSNKDLIKMQVVFDAKDFNTLTRLGHTSKGTGYAYGFRGMGDIGRELESAAKEQDAETCQQLIVRMEHYLANVKVEFGD